MRVLLALAAAGLAAGCGDDAAPDEEQPLGSVSQALSSFDCTEWTDTGYVQGNPVTITLVTVDGKPVQVDTANAYYVMAVAAEAAGVEMQVVSGFRTMAEQEYLYSCYVNCNCNNCNLAAQPGYSNHQSGHALDLNTSAPGVYDWLAANGGAYGFTRTVPSEAWHWEWWGGGPGGGICECKPLGCDGTKLVSACGSGDCAPYGATCVNDQLGPRCVSVFCPAIGDAKTCLPDGHTIGNCHDGAISTDGDCGAYGAICNNDGGAHCVAPYAANAVGVTSDATKEKGSDAFHVCAGSKVSIKMELENTGWVPWSDVNDTAAGDLGKAVRLGTSNGDATMHDFADPLTKTGRISVSANDNADVHYDGPDCNDKAGCRRTVFHVDGTAPAELGSITTSWQLVDEQRAWFGPVVSAQLDVVHCDAAERPISGGHGAMSDSVGSSDPNAALPDDLSVQGSCGLGAAPWSTRADLAAYMLGLLVLGARRRSSRVGTVRRAAARA